jgi:hypothetical protein
MPKEEPSTEELRVRQQQRREEERRLTEETGEHEAAQHRRRAQKLDYLEGKLAERKRSERGGEG